MAMKEIAVVGCTLTLDSPAVGTANFTGPPSTTSKAGGQFIYKDSTVVTVAIGVNDGTATSTAPGVGNMPSTAVKNKADGSLVLRVDDEITISGVAATLNSNGNPTVMTYTVKITDAGQTKATGE